MYTTSAWIATPVTCVAPSRLPDKAPIARKKAYMVMVMMNKNSRLMKNCEAVLERCAMKYTVMSNKNTWMNTRGMSTTVWAIAKAAGR